MNNLLLPTFEAAPNVKILINIGATLDIPTGFYVKGLHGEYVLNGGLGQLTGVVGIGNSFKSTIMHYMMLSAVNRLFYTTPTTMSTYDTEINIHEERLKSLTIRFENFKNIDILNEAIWVISDKTQYYANKWYEILKSFFKSKEDNRSKLLKDSPFPNRDGKTLLRVMVPTFSEIDSFSEFETEDVAKIQDDNELGDSGGNTIHMRQGLAKTRFMMELPNAAMSVNHFILMTAHIGKDINMASGPMPQAPVRKLMALKNGDKIKGVTDKFFFLMSNCWQATNVSPLVNQSTKSVEYPKDPSDNRLGDLDLNIITLRNLRSKAGPTGYSLEIIVSQIEGVLSELTEFHYIKSSDRFGISGTLQHYALDLFPDVKLSRTTIRSKIEEFPKLCRALNITSELCQMQQYQKHLEYLCTPKELFDGLKAKGYNWDTLLDTRGWWTLDNDTCKIPFLSTLDLLHMLKGEYIPYWMTKDEKKNIK